MTFSKDSIADKIQRMMAESEHFETIAITLDPGAHLMYLMDTVEHFMNLHKPDRAILNFSSIASFYVARLAISQGVDVLAIDAGPLTISHPEDSDEYRAIMDIVESNPQVFDARDYPYASQEMIDSAVTLMIPSNGSFSASGPHLVVDMAQSANLEVLMKEFFNSRVDFLMGPAVGNERRMNMEQRPIRPIFDQR